MMSSATRGRASWWLILSFIGTFLISQVAAGHGVGPVAMLLVLGWQYWTAAVLTGWTGISLLVASKLVGTSVAVADFGALLILASWALFLWQAEVRRINLVTSIPFFAAVLFWTARLGRNQRAG